MRGGHPEWNGRILFICITHTLSYFGILSFVEQKVVGIYHKSCIDGTTAAAVLCRKFPETKTYSLSHDFGLDDITPILKTITPDTKVFTLDCALGVQEILTQGSAVTTIDHHISVNERLNLLAKTNTKFTYVFDNEKSGASLTWSYFFSDSPIPEVIRLVEDSDLWRWKFGDDTKYVNNYLSTLVNKPEEILPLLIDLPKSVKEQGAIISQYAKILIDQFVSEAKPVTLFIGPYTVPAYNVTTFFKSEIGDSLSKISNSPVCLFTIIGERVRLSFRSQKGQHPSPLELATIAGGGGHENAAGASIPIAVFLNMLHIGGSS